MLDFTRLMLISTQVEVVVEVGVELGNFIIATTYITCRNFKDFRPFIETSNLGWSLF